MLRGGDDEEMNQVTPPAAATDQTQPRNKDAAARWRKLLEDQRASGLPISAFCRERGIPASSLFAWRSKLRGTGTEIFKAVAIVPDSKPRRYGGDDAGAIELCLPGERRLRVRRGFDRQLLWDLISALELLA